MRAYDTNKGTYMWQMKKNYNKNTYACSIYITIPKQIKETNIPCHTMIVLRHYFHLL